MSIPPCLGPWFYPRTPLVQEVLFPHIVHRTVSHFTRYVLIPIGGEQITGIIPRGKLVKVSLLPTSKADIISSMQEFKSAAVAQYKEA